MTTSEAAALSCCLFSPSFFSVSTCFSTAIWLFLLFGLFFLFFSATIFFNGQRTFIKMRPEVPFEVAWKIKDFSMFVIYPILCVYACCYFRSSAYRKLIWSTGP